MKFIAVAGATMLNSSSLLEAGLTLKAQKPTESTQRVVWNAPCTFRTWQCKSAKGQAGE